MRKTKLIPLLVASIIAASMWSGSDSANAYLTGFNPANIMSDSVMSNKNTMTEAQIQTFLKSKNPCNKSTQSDINYAINYMRNTNNAITWNIKDGRFVCMADEKFGADGLPTTSSNGETAARIIWQAAQDYSINPQVLIVLLEKEQSLITDQWPNSNQYKKATGYGCPDTAPCDTQYFGLRSQIRWAASLFRTVLDGGWTNYPVGVNFILYNPDRACGGSNVNIENRATSALYRYTPYQPNAAALAAGWGTAPCGAYGNRNFYNYFTDWFGSTQKTNLPGDCDSRVDDVVCVWSIIKTDGSQFLTSSKSERDITLSDYGWMYDGLAFYASKTQSEGTIPVRRLRYDNKHYYSVDQSEYDTLKSSTGWVDEGIAFYVLPATASSSMSYRVYKLYNPSNNYYRWVKGGNQKNQLIDKGYNVELNAFNTFSGLIDLPITAANRNNIYKLKTNSGGHFYTTSLTELETVIGMGYKYEGVLTTASALNLGTAVHRLQYSNGHFYTTSITERDNAVRLYGMKSEGIGFYIDDISLQIYRLANIGNGRYLYTSDTNEAMSLANNGWRYEALLIDNGVDRHPVYRFLNLQNNRHFYTTSVNEAMQITNKNWRYETISFYASKQSGRPVYRMRLNDKHFYTASASEKDVATSKYGYVYEGIAFYVSQVTTNKPVYRLQGGNDEYFYTASSAEKDSAVNKHGYRYEGEGFYLVSNN